MKTKIKNDGRRGECSVLRALSETRGGRPVLRTISEMRGGHGVPRKMLEGRVLAHNHVRHGREWP
jgi:hypothetical protein